MNKIFTLTFLLLVSFYANGINPTGQSKGTSEKSMFKQAEKYFLKKDYEKATPLYAQLVSTHTDNYKLNYCYGICLLITDKDKSKAVKYLEAASKSIVVWDDVWYYLGRAYQLNGDFNKSLGTYDQFLKMVSVKQAMRWEAMHQMEMCKNAQLFSYSADSFSILETKTISSSQPYDSYTFSKNERKILSLPLEFSAQNDSKNPDCSKTFLSADGTKMVFSSYGKEGGKNTDIYWAEKNQNGMWQKAVRIGDMVNTKYDEAFPTLSEDGFTLFFSSKGHNSMGGFDIFKSVYYPEIKQWSKSQNMGAPVNSVDDDFYYVESATENIAYYSSKYGCNVGEVKVNKISIGDDPKALLVIHGEVFNEYASPYREAIIMLTKEEGGETVTTVVSNPVNGKYHFNLSEAGNYRVSVRIEGFGPMAQSISFSANASGKVNQTIKVSKDTLGYDKLSITNVFEKKDEYTLASKILPASKLSESEIDNPENKTVSTGYEPVTAYVPGGLPPVSDESKAKLVSYFNQQHPGKEVRSCQGLTQLGKGKIRGNDYKVQIGTFMHQSVEQVYGKLKEMGFDDISYYTNKKGWIIFYTGHAKDLSSTLKLKDMVIAYGFSDAFITVFENGRPSRMPKVK